MADGDGDDDGDGESTQAAKVIVLNRAAQALASEWRGKIGAEQVGFFMSQWSPKL